MHYDLRVQYKYIKYATRKVFLLETEEMFSKFFIKIIFQNITKKQKLHILSFLDDLVGQSPRIILNKDKVKNNMGVRIFEEDIYLYIKNKFIINNLFWFFFFNKISFNNKLKCVFSNKQLSYFFFRKMFANTIFKVSVLAMQSSNKLNSLLLVYTTNLHRI